MLLFSKPSHTQVESQRRFIFVMRRESWFGYSVSIPIQAASKSNSALFLQFLTTILQYKREETSLQEVHQYLHDPTTPLMHATEDIQSEDTPATFHYIIYISQRPSLILISQHVVIIIRRVINSNCNVNEKHLNQK